MPDYFGGGVSAAAITAALGGAPALDSTVVHLAGAEAITGAKSFSPTVGNQFASSAFGTWLTGNGGFSQFSFKADITFNETNGGSIPLELTATGATPKIGFLGAAPVARAAAITAPIAPGVVYAQAEAQSCVAAVNAIRAALTAIGITL